MDGSWYALAWWWPRVLGLFWCIALGVSAKISLDRSGCKFNPIMGHCEILHSLLVHWFVCLLDRLFPHNVAPAWSWQCGVAPSTQGGSLLPLPSQSSPTGMGPAGARHRIYTIFCQIDKKSLNCELVLSYEILAKKPSVIHQNKPKTPGYHHAKAYHDPST